MLRPLTVPSRVGAAVLGLALLAGCLGEFFDPTNQAGLTVVFAPRDTTLYPGASFQARAEMRNHYGDVYPSEHIEYGGSSDVLAVDRSGLVTGRSYGRAPVVAHRGDLLDTGWVSVVPHARLAMSFIGGEDPPREGPSAVDIVQLDGSGLRRITVVHDLGGAAPAWLPGGAGLVFHDQDSVTGVNILYRSDTLGHVVPLLPTPDSGSSEEKYARISRDGAWVYFRLAGRVPGAQIWRIHPDGTGLEQVTSGGSDTQPDPSPDGTRLVFSSNRFNFPAFEICVRELASGTEQSLGVAGLLPRWSPTGDRIAYWSGNQFGDQGAIFVMGSDGLGSHQVSPARRVYSATGLDWTPDGQWLLASTSLGLELIEVSTGQTLPLAYTSRYQWGSLSP